MLKSTAEISRIVEETVQGLGYEFVDLERLPNALLRVTIDTENEGGICVDDCQTVSDQLTHLFTVEEIEYDRLEVSSPGVERSLKRAAEWKRFIGSPVHVELYEPLHAEGLPEAGRRRFDGRILAVEGEPGQEQIQFSFEEIKVARTPSEAALARTAKAKKTNTNTAVTITFAFNDVDRAHIIAQLDFKGKK